MAVERLVNGNHRETLRAAPGWLYSRFIDFKASLADFFGVVFPIPWFKFMRAAVRSS